MTPMLHVLTVNTFDAYYTGAYLNDSMMLLSMHILMRSLIFKVTSVIHSIEYFVICFTCAACEEECYNVHLELTM